MGVERGNKDVKEIQDSSQRLYNKSLGITWQQPCHFNEFTLSSVS